MKQELEKKFEELAALANKEDAQEQDVFGATNGQNYADGPAIASESQQGRRLRS